MEEIKTILSKKLLNNDINIVNKILEFLKPCKNCKSLEIYKYWNQVDPIDCDWDMHQGEWSDNILDCFDIHMGYCKKCYINLPMCSCREKRQRHEIYKCSNCKESICAFCGNDVFFCQCSSLYCHSDCYNECVFQCKKCSNTFCKDCGEDFCEDCFVEKICKDCFFYCRCKLPLFNIDGHDFCQNCGYI